MDGANTNPSCFTEIQFQVDYIRTWVFTGSKNFLLKALFSSEDSSWNVNVSVCWHPVFYWAPLPMDNLTAACFSCFFSWWAGLREWTRAESHWRLPEEVNRVVKSKGFDVRRARWKLHAHLLRCDLQQVTFPTELPFFMVKMRITISTLQSCCWD